MNRQIDGYKDTETDNQEDKQTILKDGMIDRSIQINIQNIDRVRQIDRWIARYRNEQMDRWKINGQLFRQINIRYIESYSDRQKSRQIDRQIKEKYKQIDRQMSRKKDKKID